ncbi:MAG: pilin [Candidatus Woesearchaeota archaeon]|nr:pilin [Candidatus Woesearchaeota archaeon]
MRKILFLAVVLALFIMPIVLAETAPIDTTISAEDKAKFDEILKPVQKIYNFVKYIASAIALLFLLYGGISFMTAGSDPRQKDNAKNIILYVVIGLLIIWAAPLIVGLLVS